MSALENAMDFFTACETAQGWAGCEQYCADNATFNAQSEPLIDVATVKEYCDWMAGFANITTPGATYDLHSSSYDDESRTAVFFATYHGKHTGEGGPIPPTQKETSSHYVYALTMDENDKVKKMIKIWNAPWAMRELGWA